jgi:hypothetical protein
MYEGAVKFDSIATILKEKIFEYKMDSTRNKKKKMKGLKEFSL